MPVELETDIPCTTDHRCRAIRAGSRPVNERGYNLMPVPKGDRAHRLVGRIWVLAMYWTVLSSFLIIELRPGHYSWIHGLSLFTFGTLSTGLWAALTGRIRLHPGLMTGSYFGLLGAFVGAVAVPVRRASAGGAPAARTRRRRAGLPARGRGRRPACCARGRVEPTASRQWLTYVQSSPCTWVLGNSDRGERADQCVPAAVPAR